MSNTYETVNANGLGTAGSPSGGVVSVQGVASGTPIIMASSMSGTVPGTAPSYTSIVGGIYNSSAPSPSSGQTLPFQLDSSGNLKVTGAGGGTQYSDGTTQATPTGTVALGKNGSNVLHAISLDGSGNLNINVAASALTDPAEGTTGSAVPSKAIQVGGSDGTNLQALLVESSSHQNLRVALYNGSTEASVTGSNALKVDGSAVTQPISGTVTANAGTGTFNIQSNASVNVAQVGGNAVSTAANGTQLVGVADGAGNALTSNSTTYTSKKALDGNLLGTLGTAFTTAGKVDVKGASGDVIVYVKGNAGSAFDASIAAGTAPTNGVAVVGQYNTTIPAPTAAQTVGLQIASDAALYVNTESRKATYSCYASFTAAAGVIAVLPGSSSKTIRVLRVEVSLSTSGTAGIETISLIKTSSAPSGGTSSSMTAVPHDSNYSAASAAPLNYTGAPTGGTAVGTVRGIQFNDGSATLPGANTWLWDWGVRPGTAVVLRGTSQALEINLGAAISTQTATVSFEWTEE